MKQYKDAKVILLPTQDNPTSISIGNNSKIVEYHEFLFGKKGGIYNNHTFQHLHVISDDEKKEGDWFITKNNEILQVKKYEKGYSPIGKKIIATTDTSLNNGIQKGKIYNSNFIGTKYEPIIVPQPSQQFIKYYIEEYNKGNIITDVLVEYNIYDDQCDGFSCSICNCGPNTEKLIYELKINTKDNTITIKPVDDTLKDIMIKNPNIREEVSVLIKKALTESKEQYSLLDRIGIDKWIEENI